MAYKNYETLMISLPAEIQAYQTRPVSAFIYRNKSTSNDDVLN